MSIARSIVLLTEAMKARQVVNEAAEAMRIAAERRDWGRVEILRSEAVIAFEAMLDASIAAQREGYV